jgi:hypothetical protein
MQLGRVVFVSYIGAFYFWCNLSACFYAGNWKFTDRSFLRNNSYIFSDDNPEPVFVIGELVRSWLVNLIRKLLEKQRYAFAYGDGLFVYSNYRPTYLVFLC